MAYAIQTCWECKQRMMATDGIMPAHCFQGGKINCEGSGELSAEADALADNEQSESSSSNSENDTEAKPLRTEENKPGVAKTKKIIPKDIPQNGNGEHFKVEKGIPLPKRNARDSRYREILSGMQVGDSFIVPFRGKGGPQAARIQASKLNIKVTQRRLNDNEIRIWRVK